MKKIFFKIFVVCGMGIIFFLVKLESADAAIAFRNASPAVSAASGNISPAMPVGTVANDVMVMAIVADDNVVITFPAGWGTFNELNNGTGLRSTMAVKRAAAGEAGPYTVTHTGGNSITGAIVSYSGVLSSGSPVDVLSARANIASLTTTANSITTTVDNELVIFTSHYGNDFTAGHGNTPYTCVTGPASFNGRIDAETTLGLDSSLAIADAIKSPAGATGTCTESMTGTAAVNIGALVALKPEPPANQITVGAALTQPSYVVEGNPAVVMGAFTFISSASAATVNSIKISEKGTVNANLNLGNAKLYAQQESTCTFAGSTQIGTTQSFTATDDATFGSLNLSVDTPLQQCVFVVLDIGTLAGAGNTMEIEITASGDVTATGGTIAGTFPVQISGSTLIRADSGTIMSTEVDFDWLPGQTSWGEAIWSTSEPEGDIKIQVYYTPSTTCNTIIPDAALSGNAAGFDVTASPLDISGLSTTTYNRICLKATLTAGSSVSPTLNSWAIKWKSLAISFTQSSYRLFQNEDSVGVTTALASQDTSTSINGSQPFRLRLLIHIGSTALNQNGQSFKLQYATKSSACGTYADVTSATSIAYINNPAPNDGDFLSTSTLDPIHGGDTTVSQTYEEANNFTNSKSIIPANQDGEWDFALKSNGITSSSTYCLRAVKADGSALDAYSAAPEVNIVVYSTLGTYVSSDFNASKLTAFNVIEWKWIKSNPSCVSCNIKLQIKTSADGTSWTPTWSGPLGDNGDELDYYTVSTGEMTHPDHNDKQWIRYRATFEGDGTVTPILDEIKIYYKP